MYSLGRPTDHQIRIFLSQQEGAAFSYAEVGATRETPPPGYTVDRYRIKLGHGEKTFQAARAAVSRWAMFQIPWIQLCWPDFPLRKETTVAVLVRCFNLWILNAARIVYLIDERGAIQRFGFAYGTLPTHAEQGEERFTVEWLRSDNSVWYGILAFSRPNRLLSCLAYPYVRHLQKRFGHASLQAMARATAGSSTHSS